MLPNNTITLDFETRSAADIQEVGAYEYSLHPSTDILVLCAYDHRDGQMHEFDLSINKTCPDFLCQALAEGTLVNAFNTAFEFSIWRNVQVPRYGWPEVPLSSWRDTQATCLVNGFPASLDGAAKALKLDDKKDPVGQTLINFFSRPVTSGHAKGSFRNPADHPERFADFIRYCAQDVRTTVACEAALPAMQPKELTFWQVSFARNLRGIAVDHALVRGLQSITGTAKQLVGEKLKVAAGEELTIDNVATNHGRVLRFVQNQGVNASSVDKKSVRVLLADESLDANARVVLEARTALGKNSVSKLDKWRNMSASDGRLRFVFRHHGAATGRDSSDLQTIPRGGKFDVEALVTAATAGDTETFLKASTPKKSNVFDPMGAVVTCLRGCLCASPGRVFLQCDWNAVEPRIISWLAGCERMLNDFREIDAQPKGVERIDIYMKSAAPFFGLEPRDVKGDYRQFGKVYILQNQYGAGAGGVQRSAKDQYGVMMDFDTAQLCVDVFRATYPEIPAFGRSLEAGAISATKRHGQVIRCGKIAFCHDGKHLRMRLPSGRAITYPWAEVRNEVNKFGNLADSVHYYGLTIQKQWVDFTLYSGQLLNNATQGTGACLMREKVIEMTAAGFDIVLPAHDELVADDYAERFDEFKRIMLTPPDWASDLPLNGEGWIGPRFKKD